MSYDSEWYSDPVTQKVIASMLKKRDAHVVSLISSATESADPSVQKHGAAIRAIDHLLREIGSRKSEPETEE